MNRIPLQSLATKTAARLTRSARGWIVSLTLLGPTFLLADSSWVYFGNAVMAPGAAIYVAPFDAETGIIGQPVPAAPAWNPVFLAVAPNHRFLYAISGKLEGSKVPVGHLKAYRIDKTTGALSLVNDLPTGGPEPTHILVDPTGHSLLLANYLGGYVEVYSILEDGSVGKRTAIDRHIGSGPNAERQEGPHAHSVNIDPSGRYAIVDDLGVDKIFVYRFDGPRGSLEPNDPPSVAVKPGSGPRHFAFHPSGRFAYAVTELASTVIAFRWDADRGVLDPLQTVSLLPPGFSGVSTAAEIAVDRSGRHLYASNRGDDSIVVFLIDQETGLLSFVQRMGAGIKVPRSFAIDPTGKWLVCANLASDSACVFRIDSESGRLTPTGQSVKVPKPICVQFLER